MANPHQELGRRERQIMDIVYRRGHATAEEVRIELTDELTNSAVRGMLRLLEEKGYLRHETQGLRYVYWPTADTEQVQRGAVQALVRTFFRNSASSAVAAMLGEYGRALTPEELERLEQLIDDVRGQSDVRGQEEARGQNDVRGRKKAGEK